MGWRLEQEIDGSSEAESGKNNKQDQVHRSLNLWREPGVTIRLG